ncbi:hypothetical protein Tco_1403990 [Tanacetum coccineum]
MSNTNMQTQTSSVLQNDTVSSCSISKVQEKTQLSRIKCMNSLRAIQSQLKFLIETLQDFGNMHIFKRTFSQDLDLLENHLTKEIISQTDCKTTLTKLRTTFENAFNSELKARMQNYTRYDAQSFYDAMIFNMDSLGKYMLELILHQQRTPQLLKQKKLMQTQEDHSNPIPALNVDSLKVDLVVIQNTCSEKEDSNSETASSKLVKECSLNSETKDVHAIKYKMSKAKERCMAYFRSLHSHLQVLSKDDLKGTRIEHGFKRAFMSLFGQDVDTFTRTMLLNSNDNTILCLNTLDSRYNTSDIHYSTPVKCLRSPLLKEHVIKDSMKEGTDSTVQDDSSRSGNDTDADDADIIPIYDEEPMAEYPETCQVKSPMLDSSPDNQTTEYSKQSLESENILLKETVAQFQKDFSRMEAHCIALELKYQNQSLKSGQHGQILNETSNKAKIEKEIDVLETMNIELEHSVATLRKENETLKQHYKDLYDSIKITRSKTTEQTTSLLANNAELKAQIQEKVFAIAALKNDLRKLKGNSVDTKFDKTSVLGKPVLPSLRNQSVVRQPNAFKSARAQMSKQRFASQVDVNKNLSKPVTQHYLPKKTESTFAKPDHMIASSSSRNSSKNMPRFSSNDMVHNHYLDVAKKKIQERDRNSTTSVPTSARIQTTTDDSKPNPRSNNQTSRSLPVSKSSRVTITVVPKADHSKSSISFSDSKNFVCSTCHKCVFNANHDACITKLLKEVNSSAKTQSNKTINSNKPVDQKSHTQKPGRQIFIGHRFSPNKTSVVYEKTSPRSDLKWKPTGRIFESVSLRNIASDHVSSDPGPQCSTTVLEQDSLSPGPQSQENVPQVAETVTTSNELELLYSPMFSELLNGNSPVVSKSSAVHAADNPDKRQQHNTTHTSTTTDVADPPPLNIHSTHQTPTQVPTVTAPENIIQAETNTENAQFDDDEFINIFSTPVQEQGETSSYALSWKPCQGDSLNLPDHRAQVDQGSQIKMIQVKEMMQDNDLKNLKSKDKGSKSRSQSMDEQSHYKQDKTITRQSINVKRHIFNVIGDTEKFEERDLNIGGDC